MRSIFFIGLFLINVALSFGQKGDDPVLLKIGGDEVKLSEFKAIYNKNNSENAIDPKSVEEYLDLYINFKLKVKEAEDLGMDTTAKFRKELKGYRDQLARPYLTDKEVTDQLIEEVYERMQTEVKASHILLSIPPNATPADTLEIFNKIMKIKEEAENGKPFDELAKEHSNDPSVHENGGDLGYFTALYMVYPFENESYNTEVGEISNPVRTRYGYHLIKVTDKRPARGEMTAAHIMVKLSPKANEEEIKNAKAKVDELYQKVKNGEDFGQLAIQFSDDKGSAKRGGMLAPFKAGKMVPEFEEAAFNLQNDGDISEPVKSKYGWHIIKRVKLNTLPELDEIRVDLKEKISRDSRSNQSKLSMLNKIKSNYNFKEKLESRNDFYSVLDTTFFKSKWDISKAKGLDDWIVKLGKKTYTQQDFAKHINKLQSNGTPLEMEYTVNLLYEDFVQKISFQYENDRLEEKYPEFRMLVQEYHDGILLFDLTDEKVWSKAVQDTTGLEKFFETQKDKYKWDERLDATIYSCASKEIAEKARNLVEQREVNTISPDSLQKILNKDSKLNITVKSNKFSKGDNELIDGIAWEKGITDIQKNRDRFVFVEVIEKLEPRAKTLDEVRGLVTSDYQNHLEQEWIKELKSKYEVTVNKSVLKSME